MVSLTEMDYTRKLAARILDRVKKAESMATRSTTILDGMPHQNGMTSKVETGAIAVADLQTEYKETLKSLERMKAELESMINTIDDPDRRAVLWLRYLGGHSAQQIADACCLSLRGVFYHIKAGKEELSRRYANQFEAD